MRTKIRQVILGLALALLSSLTLAGLVLPSEVIITLNDDGSGSVRGDMLTARVSDNDVEFIGCGIRSFDDGAGSAFEFGFCQATDAAELNVICTTQNAGLLDSMRTINDYSFITFAFDDLGECTNIGFSTQSFYLPNKKAK